MESTVVRALGKGRCCVGCNIMIGTHEECVERDGKPYHEKCGKPKRAVQQHFSFGRIGKKYATAVQ